MSSFDQAQSNGREKQVGTTRGVSGVVEDVPGAGRMMSVRSTGRVDLEVPIGNFGFGYRLPDDSNAEVVMLAMGGDPNDKMAFPMLPRDVQYSWAEGHGGIQDPTTPDRRIDLGGGETVLHDGRFVIGSNREVVITVDGANVQITTGGNATIQAQNLTLQADNVEVTSATLTHNGRDIGENHRHDGVATGGGNTGTPI